MGMTEQRLALKDAVRLAVHKAGGAEAASRFTRANKGLLSKYGSTDYPEYAPIDICFDLDVAANEPVILRALADLHGFDLVERDSEASTLKRDLLSLTGSLAKESGEAVFAALQATSTGSSINSLRASDKEFAELESVVVNSRSVIRKTIASKL